MEIFTVVVVSGGVADRSITIDCHYVGHRMSARVVVIIVIVVIAVSVIGIDAYCLLRDSVVFLFDVCRHVRCQRVVIERKMIRIDFDVTRGEV